MLKLHDKLFKIIQMYSLDVVLCNWILHLSQPGGIRLAYKIQLAQLKHNDHYCRRYFAVISSDEALFC